MKQKYRLLLLVIFLLPFCNSSYAQFYGTVGAAGNASIFLPGRYLEIGINNIGAFGAVVPGTDAPPAGYHPYPAGPLAEVYDYGHDGWTVGTPNFYGDYTYPGSPFEGWEIQVNGTARGQAFTTGTASAIANTGGMGLAGWNTSYVDAGGLLTANWAGTTAGSATVAPLSVTMQSVVDTLGNTVNVTVVLKNTSATLTAPNVYYLRSCDPDNDEAHGGSFATNNTVLHQNEDASHDVEVDAVGGLYGDHWSICTKDCRAKAFVYSSWPLAIGDNLATIWSTEAVAGGSEFTLGTPDDGDIAIAIVYNLGTINAGDSAVVSYAYIFNDPYSTIDSAFPDPVLVVDGISVPNSPIPDPTIDTFNTCGTTLTSVPVSIINATTGTWTWSQWTWAPATGLAATTGVTNTINVSAIPATITYTITGTDSAINGFTCNNKTFYLTIKACNSLIVNSPCAGDTLQFTDRGDSLGVTYAWTGPDGFTSTLQNPFIYPASTANTGEYYVVKTIGGADSTDSIYATVHYLPVVSLSSNAPLCTGTLDTLALTATPDSTGETFTWTGPNSFTSTLQDPTVPGYSPSDTGTYKVVTSVAGCTDSATIDVGIVPPPAGPVLSSYSPYCQMAGSTIAITVSGLAPGSTLLWYTSATGGTGSPVAPVVSIATPGTQTFYASQIEGSCESVRDSINIQTITTPPAPAATGTFVYCQLDTDFVPLTIATVSGGIPLWYSAPTGGIGSTTEPVVNLEIAGANTSYVSQIDSNCESITRTPVTITVNPHPVLPVVTPQVYCQYLPSAPVIAVGSPGSTLTWFGTDTLTGGTTTPPAPSTTVAGTDSYYVQQSITTLGKTCYSYFAPDPVVIAPQPAPPITANLKYCQFSTALPLTAIGRSLYWYFGGALIDSTTGPVPPTNVPNPSGTTWYVTQSIDSLGITCQSDSASLTVSTIYLPDFTITPTTSYDCQYDSITLTYTGTGTVLDAPGYTWVLPAGAHLANGSLLTGSPSIMVTFDALGQDNFVYLTASDDSGFCSTTDTLFIKVVAQPYATSYSRANICLGDTTTLSLSSQSADADTYVWQVDGVPLASSNVVNVIASSSNSGGPYSLSWNDSGIHVVELNTFTQEKCASLPSFDTVLVHTLPDANFIYTTKSGGLCLEDSVLFSAVSYVQNDSYTWGPASSFNNINSQLTWGRLQESVSIITLTVSDPFGCTATTQQSLDPSSCCTVAFPTAFTPGNTINRVFRPVLSGYHNFHDFRIANRWGQTIFESAGTNVSWDGNYNGVPQDMGVYYYYIKFDCGGNTVEQKGDVTLIR
jgi:gliding motility-associated-like protein